jgi:hypothetical protein
MDEGGERRDILERRDGVTVRHTGELGATPGEAPDVVTQTFPWLLPAVV